MQQQMFCSNCRTALYPNAQGCHQCGAMFYSQPQAPQGPPSMTPGKAGAMPGAGQAASGYGAPGYGAPGYGASGYGAPGYGAPGYGMPPGVGMAVAPMGFGRAISTCFRKYATFRGRAGRAEFWYFYLFNMLISVALVSAFLVLNAADEGSTAGMAFLGLWLLYSVAATLPALAVTVRRLHDTGRSGWFMLLALIPLVGPIVLYVFYAQQGPPGPNQYGLPES